MTRMQDRGLTNYSILGCHPNHVNRILISLVYTLERTNLRLNGLLEDQYPHWTQRARLKVKNFDTDSRVQKSYQTRDLT